MRETKKKNRKSKIRSHGKIREKNEERKGNALLKRIQRNEEITGRKGIH